MCSNATASAKGDRVLIYLPLVPEAAIAMLACARIGAVHSVVFGGFSAQSVADRIADCGAKLIITADGGFRRGAIVQLKKNVDDALNLKNERRQLIAATATAVIVLRRCYNDIHMQEGRDFWWHRELEYVTPDCPPAKLEARPRCSSSTPAVPPANPRASSTPPPATCSAPSSPPAYVFDLKPDDVYWCTADVGWVTGHSYLVYGPLANGATSVMYEGAPNWPEPDRFWRIVEKYGVTILYTAPTAIRAFMKWGDEWPKKHNLRPSASSARSANPSIPKPGCGTTRSSAAAAAPSSTPGGRPKPAAS
jgi:acetyl-CoA synthetase